MLYPSKSVLSPPFLGKTDVCIAAMPLNVVATSALSCPSEEEEHPLHGLIFGIFQVSVMRHDARFYRPEKGPAEGYQVTKHSGCSV